LAVQQMYGRTPVALRYFSFFGRWQGFDKGILIVDDEPDIVRLLQVTLRPEGFRLLSAR
jgi:hypothetical protein